MLELRPYQVEDVELLIAHDSYGVFNQQRTGKSPTTVVALAKKTQGRVVIVCTKSMLYVWKKTVHDFTTRPCFVYAGTKKQRETALESFRETPNAFLAISYGMFKTTKLTDGLQRVITHMKPDGLIVDEAHRCAGRKTSNFKSLRMTRYIPYRYYLTGTPAPNHPAQVWAILTQIDPKRFTSYWRFVEEFFVIEEQRLPAHVAYKTGVSTTQSPSGFLPGKADDYVNLLAEYSIMRKRADVMPWLLAEEPPTRIPLPLTASQQKYLKQLTEYFETEHVMTQGVLDQIMRYRQICLDPKILGLTGGSPKTEWLSDYLDDYPEKQVIVFSRFTEYLRILEKDLGVEVLVGATPPHKRQDLIDRFQDGRLRVLAIQIDAGKEGLTLDSADSLIFTDVYPPASDILQARDRIVATAETRNKPKEIIELMMEDSYDALLYDIVDHRLEITDIANNYIKYLKGGL